MLIDCAFSLIAYALLQATNNDSTSSLTCFIIWTPLSAFACECSAAYEVVVTDGEWQSEYFEFDPEAMVETVER